MTTGTTYTTVIVVSGTVVLMSSTFTTRLLPDALKMARNTACLSQARLAEMAGISVGYIGMIELGQRHPKREVCQRLADALGVPIGAIAFVAEEEELVG